MLLAMELDSTLDSQVSSMILDTNWAMDIDSLQKVSKNSLSDFPRPSSTIIHKYYSYILFATIKLFPMKEISNKQINVRMIETPKPRFSQISEKGARIENGKFPMTDDILLPQKRKVKQYLFMTDDILLPQKRKVKQYLFPTKYMKLSFYNDVMTF
ncbi:hypothetical protein SteCoe_35180 [Stentor coeruleus]|uniref:Uncharacterized protein n=1 Tax=Stentor coeruleus TaxID=5963 RepID=A0A1R2ASX2_9CILI|nr:hypothetical protein SteCoe_35180 [Stentor coeruleus]